MTSVNGVNAYTKNGNPYKKTHTCKKVLTGIVATGCAVSMITSAVVLHKMPPARAKGFKGVKEFLSTLGVVNLKYLSRNIKSVGTAFLVGLGIDAIVNKVRRNKADKKADVLNTKV